MKRSSMLLGVVAAVGLAAVGLVSVEAGPQKDRTRAPKQQQRRSALASAPANAQPIEATEGGVAGGVGPDVIVGHLHNLSHYTTGGAIGGKRAYSVGTISCNIGTENLLWIAETNQHPVIGQSMYRMKNGRFEQIGQSWLKHGFFALWENLCTPCENGSFTVCQGDCLIVGCSDPYDSSLNGDNSGLGLGPKSQVNASTGFFPFPHSTSNCGTATLCQRLQVNQSDLEPHATGTTAVYFVEGQYITPDDAAAGNGNNNASYRRIWVNLQYGITFNNLGGAGQSQTVQQLPAIFAWQAADPTVEMAIIDIPGDGRIHVAWKVTDNANGTWTYEYAVHNLNSDRSIGSFALPIGNATTSNIGFHDVDYHSGEPYDGADWNGFVDASDFVVWQTAQSYAQNPNANAIRWGTLYNFRFTADKPPVSGDVTLGLFKPASAAGGPNQMVFTAKVPEHEVVGCIADMVDHDTFEPPPDGIVDGADLAVLLLWWGTKPESPADFVSNVTFQPPPDGITDGADLAFLLGEWGPCD